MKRHRATATECRSGIEIAPSQQRETVMHFTPKFLRHAAVLALVTSLAALQPALARERHSTFTGPKGQVAERDVSRERGDVSSSTTGPDGKTVSRSVERGQGETQATVTGANGRVWQRQVNRSRTGATATATGPKGKVVTRETTYGSGATPPAQP
jgi:hypothetical protein